MEPVWSELNEVEGCVQVLDGHRSDFGPRNRRLDEDLPDLKPKVERKGE